MAQPQIVEQQRELGGGGVANGGPDVSEPLDDQRLLMRPMSLDCLQCHDSHLKSSKVLHATRRHPCKEVRKGLIARQRISFSCHYMSFGERQFLNESKRLLMVKASAASTVSSKR